MPQTEYQKLQTVYGVISGVGDDEFVTTALSAEDASSVRGVRRRRFAGAVISSKSTSTQSLSPTISITKGAVANTFELDRTTILPGETATWTEEDYAVDLDKDEYVKIEVSESLASADRLFISLRINDLYA